MLDVRHDTSSARSRSPQSPSHSPGPDRPQTPTTSDGSHNATTASGQPHGDSLSGLLQAAVDRRELARSSLPSPAVEITGRAAAHGPLLQRDGDDECGATHKWAQQVAMTHGSAFPAPSWGAVFWGQSMEEAVKHARWQLPPEG